MAQRVNLSKIAPKLYQTVVELDRQAVVYAASAGIDEGFAHLLRLRASQLNGCAYCVRRGSRPVASLPASL